MASVSACRRGYGLPGLSRSAIDSPRRPASLAKPRIGASANVAALDVATREGEPSGLGITKFRLLVTVLTVDLAMPAGSSAT
jgi:hypothetical protein